MNFEETNPTSDGLDVRSSGLARYSNGCWCECTG
jgi:hypothetical protein